MLFKTNKTCTKMVTKRPKLIENPLQSSVSHKPMNFCGTRALVGLLAASLLMVGCASRINQFKSFSEAGAAYADVMDKMLDESGGVSIDADSKVLIDTRSAHSPGLDGERDKKIEKHNKLLKERLVILGNIREHNQLLKSYFEALAALSESNEGTEIATATTGIVGELGKLNPKIANATLGNAPISSLIGPVTEIVVAGFQQAALERELNVNAQTIERELALQIAAIKAIGEIWKTDQQAMLNEKDKNNRIDFLQDKALPKNWAANRKAILITDSSTKLVDSATDASKKLKKIFKKLVGNQAGVEDIPLIVNDLKKVLELIELVKKGQKTS